MELRVDQDRIVYQIEGQSEFGRDEVLLAQDDNLLAGTEWNDVGYAVVPLLSPTTFTALRDGCQALVRGWVEAAVAQTLPDFRLAQYHHWIDTDELHRRVMQLARHTIPVNFVFPLDLLPIDPQQLIDRVSEILGVAVRAGAGDMPEVFAVRIVRPSRTDFNPLHRDVWIDRLRHAVNAYIPLAGSTARSSLLIIPGSQHWSEAEVERTRAGAQVNGVPYTVPAVVGTTREMHPVRPNPGEGEAMLFSSYLIHGAAANFNDDATRVSLEMRFWRAEGTSRPS